MKNKLEMDTDLLRDSNSMRIPLDSICIRSGVLCPRCRRIVESGEHSEFEVEVMKHLLDIENEGNFKFLKNSSYVKSYKVDSLLIIVLELQEDTPRSAIIRLGKTLSERIGMRVRIIQRTADPKTFIAQLISPARIQGIDSVWTPDGSVQHIVRIPKSDAKLLPLKTSEIETLLSTIYNEIYRIKISY